MLEEEIEDVSSQRDLDGAGNFQPFSDNDTTTLFQDLERELEKMVQRYHVPPTELENLFQVVQNLFEMMDTHREIYESLVEQKKELEDLWKTEKDKAKVAQRRRLELECRMEDEKLRLESENGSLQRDKASLQTKLKQAIEQRSCIEQELIRLKDKTLRDDKARKDLLEMYKRQYDKARRSSLQRAASLRSTHRKLPIAPHPWEASGHHGFKLADRRRQTTPDSFHSSEDSLPHSVTSGTGSGASELPSLGVSQTATSSALFSPPHPASLEMELEREGRDGEREREEVSEREQFSRSTTQGFGESFEEMPLGMQPPPLPPLPARTTISSPEEDNESDDEGALISPENREGLSLEEELMGTVDPDLLAPARAELEVLQQEKESWQEERERLERERDKARSAREALEGQHAQLQVEHQQIQNKHRELMEEILTVRKERDEVLDMYLDQPFDEYCITRKELLDLLRRHHNTAIELEKEKEEKQRLQNILDAKKSFLERFKQSVRKMFSRYPTARPSTSSGSSDSHTPSDDPLLDTSVGELSPPPAPPSPIIRTIAHSMAVTTNKGWLCSQDSSVSLDLLPQWIGQIPLSGIETERVECAALGRIFSSEETLGGLSTPPRPVRFNRRPSSGHHGVQQLHAEVWVATNEYSTSFIEIVDILSRTTKVRQRFMVKPSTAHIVCMKAIPGSVEESSEFTDSDLVDKGTSWVSDAFSSNPDMQRSYSDSMTANKGQLGRRGSLSDLSNSRLTPSTGGGSPEGTRGTHLTQSLSLPSSSHGAGQKICGASAVGEVSGVARRLDFSTAGGADKNGTSPSDQQPLSQSLVIPVRNQDTIVESVDGPGTSEGWWDVGSGGRGGAGERVRRRRRRTSSIMRTVMWVVTEDNRIVFYPTTHPSNISINSVTLPSRALCIEYIKGKVYIGHAQSDISVFHPDEFVQDTWDIHNPARVTLPSSNAAHCYDVKCIAAVGNNEIWVGAGPSIFFLDEQSLERCGSKFIDNWHHRPEQILPVGDFVLVATRASALYVFDRQQHEIVRRFDVGPVTSLLVSPSRGAATDATFTTPTSIKALAMDGKSIFVGTSAGCIVTIPVDKLSQKQTLPLPSPPKTPPSPPKDNGSGSPKMRTKKSASISGGVPPRKPPRKGRRSKGTQTAENSRRTSLARVRSSESPNYGGSEENESSEQEEADTVFLDQSAVSLHCHRQRVRTLLHVALPRSRRDLSSGNPAGCFNSMPNLSGSGYRLPVGQPLFKSLVVSVGSGHTEYSVLPAEPEQNIEDASARRERNKSFQLMLWGHRNSIP